MKIMLIYARTGHTTQPPIGILSIASVLEREGHEVKVWDPFGNDDFLNKIIEFNPELVGLSFISPALFKTKKFIDYLRSRLPDCIFCCGGPHVTAFPGETVKLLDVDFAVVGEGEYVLRDVCRRLERNEDYHSLPGLIYRQNAQVVRTSGSALIENLDDIPFPARHLLPFERYLAPPGQIRGIVLDRCATIHSRRGCPGRCSFCGSHIVHRIDNGKAVRIRSAANVIEEISYLKEKYKIKGIWFTDDVITNDKEWMREFCSTLKKIKLNLIWGGHARAIDIIGQNGYDMIRQMKESGCAQLDIGVESGSPRILNILRKGTNQKVIREAFDNTKKAGMRTLATFMVGNPTETHEDINMTIDLARKIKPNFTLVTFLTPTPGTDLYNTAVQEGWFDSKIYFSTSYSWSRSEYPLTDCSLPKEELKQIRAYFENKFAIRNYMSFFNQQNILFILKLLILVLKYPLRFFGGFKNFLRTRKISDFADCIISMHRHSLLDAN